MTHHHKASFEKEVLASWRAEKYRWTPFLFFSKASSKEGPSSSLSLDEYRKNVSNDFNQHFY